MDEQDEIQVELVKVDFSEINLKPGDILVLKVKANLSEAAKKGILEQLRQAVGERIKVMVIDDSMEIGIVRDGEVG